MLHLLCIYLARPNSEFFPLTNMEIKNDRKQDCSYCHSNKHEHLWPRNIQISVLTQCIVSGLWVCSSVPQLLPQLKAVRLCCLGGPQTTARNMQRTLHLRAALVKIATACTSGFGALIRPKENLAVGALCAASSEGPTNGGFFSLLAAVRNPPVNSIQFRVA